MTSDAVRRLADRYMLKTADLAPIPRPKVREPAAVSEPPRTRVRWSEERRALFDAWGPAAIYVAGPKAPVPRGIGDNRLGWPLRFGITETFQDTITRMMDVASPYPGKASGSGSGRRQRSMPARSSRL